ncbi:MAG: ArsI/CadI family heavy metal resistance metalloenzyme [Pseudomonadota bacterium]
MRLQLALNVPDLDASVDYYSRLFGVSPHKRKVGYANFQIDNPPLKLVLFENAAADERINHLGVEVEQQATLDAAAGRLTRAGIAAGPAHETDCCHSRQAKIWSTAPDGVAWEWYRITDDELPERDG